MSNPDHTSEPSPGNRDENSRPATTYGLPSLTLLVIASMVGAGVFTTSGFTLGAVGSPGRVMLCWIIGGVIAMCGAIGYGRLAQLLPQSGGEYLFLSRHVHPFAGFLAGWVSLTAGFSGAIAAAAVAFEKYAVPDNLRPDWLPDDGVAICLVLLCAVAHGLHASTGRHFQNAVVVVKLAALIAFLAVAAFKLPSHAWQPSVEQPSPEFGMDLVTAIATSVVWISLSFAGFNAAIYVASESPKAKTIVPLALLLGTFLVTVLYLLLNAVFVTAAPLPDLVWKEDIAAVAAAAIGGSKLEVLVRFAVALGLLSSVSSMIMTGPRVYSQMADDGVFPQMFSARRSGIPKSIALQALVAVSLILLQRLFTQYGLLTSTLLGLLIYLSTTLSLTSACCVATLFLPTVRRRDTRRSAAKEFASALYVVATLSAILLLVLNHEADGRPVGLWHIAGAAATLASGTIAWCAFGKQAADGPNPA